MHRLSFLHRIWPALLALVPVACGSLQGKDEARTRFPFELSPQEIHLARELAERDLAIPQNPLSPRDRIVFAKVDLLPDSRADTAQRLVNVQHYRYLDDAVILTTVDLNLLQVVRVETIPHFPVGLAPEEIDRAERMARRDDRLQSLFSGNGRSIKVEQRTIQFLEHEPLFGHRVVLLQFRDGVDYLTRPRVMVDLSNEAVIVEK